MSGRRFINGNYYISCRDFIIYPINMVEVNNLTKTAISKLFLKRVAKKVLIGENRIKEELSIAIVDKKEAETIKPKVISVDERNRIKD